ncbi:MAG TPA: biopolymer transporter ExbD [Ramlibacter sp.]|uniref:ExbD/TolR family protein n=1 Tax=Ramlibacter sp. TaxID=1917967 RepID=UPI002D80D38B|nr:biopolymer transporter ExbD [Ramlibacter sp.]HET8746560.1 biopolymer transporter ExbD [Ramlibacter sp.]
MAIRYADAQPGEDALIAQINTTPLVDVMLVLLIIFLITIPVVNSTIAVTLPREQNQRVDAQQENVIITVDAQGTTYWFDTPLPDRAALVELLQKIAAMQPQPEVHIRSDVRAEYASVGRVVLAAQQAGVARIGFLTEPPGR